MEIYRFLFYSFVINKIFYLFKVEDIRDIKFFYFNKLNVIKLVL